MSQASGFRAALRALVLQAAALALALFVQPAAWAAGVSLAWDPSPDARVVGYTVHWGTAAGSYTAQVDAGAATSRTVAGLSEGTTYYFAVAAYDAAANRSGYSNEIGTTVPYGVPVADFSANVTAGAAPLAVTFTSASTGSITTYAWSFGDGTTSSVQHPVKTYSAAGTYTVALTVTGPGGSATKTNTGYVVVSAPVDATAPSVPGSLAAAAAGSTAINLTWSASTDNVGVAGYRVERCTGTNCTTFVQIATPIGTTLGDSGLTASTTYGYRVRAVDAAGNLSAYSTVASATTAAPPDTTAPSAPGAPSATANGSTGINVSWGAATDNVGVTGYRVERCTGTNCTTFAQIATPTGTTLGDSGLTASTTYRYRVRAVDAAGNLSAYSTVASAATAAAPDTTAPSIPANLTGTVAATTLNLAWAASTDNVAVTQYRVERCQGSSTCTSFVQVATSATTTYADAGRTAGTVYRYQVRAADAAGNVSGASNRVTLTAAAPAVAPVASFTATPVTGIAPLAVNFTSTSTGSITTYAWNFGDGSASSTANPSKVYSSPGTYDISLTVTGPGGSHTATRTAFVSVAAPPASLRNDGVLVDYASVAGTVSNSNGILEPGETVAIAPMWTMTSGAPVSVTATAQVSGQGSDSFGLGDNAAAYGTLTPGSAVDCQSATGNCYLLSVAPVLKRPAVKWGVTFTETLSTGAVVSRTFPIGKTFADVPATDSFYPMIEALVWNDVSVGYADGTFQPAGGVTRMETAIFLARAMVRGGDPAIPASGTVNGLPYNCTAGGASRFADVAPTDVGCKQVHYLANRQVNLSSECTGSANVCPSAAINRSTTAVEVAGAMATGGDAGVPMLGTFDDSGTSRSYNCAVTGGSHFPDVPSSASFCRHVNYLWARGVVDGFADGMFHAADGLSRGQMAKFVANAFKLKAQ